MKGIHPFIASPGVQSYDAFRFDFDETVQKQRAVMGTNNALHLESSSTNTIFPILQLR